MRPLVFVALLGFAFADPTVYFKEEFDDGWQDRWVESKHKSDLGKFKRSAGKFYGDVEKDAGLQTSEDARFYGISARFDKFSNEGKTLVIQFTVKHEQNIDCGGGYVKLFPSSLDQKDMHGETPYNIMFGPDICGPGTKKVHVIFNYKGKNLLVKKDIRCKDDVFTHLYTLIVKPDNTYEVKIDNEKVESGELEADWDFLPPKKIPDPDAKKPEDWDDNEKIDDPNDTKPEDWDKPEHIPDPEAKKPEDWDDDMDGEWEPAMIDNPEYKGEWKPKQIDNPAYKGKWVHPEIDNPEYKEDPNLYSYEDFGAIGLDLWQVKSGTIFDNFLITDDVAFAEQFGKDTWGKTKDAEKEMKDKQDEEERKQREEEDKKRKDEEDANKKDDEDEEAEEEDDEADEAESDTKVPPKTEL
ncbi:calreticulin-like [Biomphalaria glabrata]|uniref:Calreticulin n=1 Tax=Biomphalaria glabrata TaxID=6526 RepID=A0A9U8E6G4_BIOGL|nr:calreticulin-like [Biomphalaria glabrata]KAI8773779.1 calreticulin [Biomphalaria glabrata]